jgi:predicted outer membrane repeat protein
VNALTRAGWLVAAGSVVAATLAGGTAASAATRAARPVPPATRLAHVRHAPALNSRQVRDVRSREAVMAAHPRAVPRFAATGAAATTFTVNSPADSGLAAPTGTTCVDSETTPHCSLRAAIEAADNLGTAAAVKVPSGTYELTTGDALSVTDPAGVSVTGAGSASTTIEGDGSGIIDESPPSGSAPSPALFLTGVRLTGGADGEGGAIYLGYDNSGAQAVLTRDALTGNTATDGGGAIYASYEDSLYLTDTTVSGNHAPAGAGIYEYWSYLDLVGDAITFNTTTAGGGGEGGGIYTEYGVVDLTGGLVSRDTAGDSADLGLGGGIYDDGYADITLDRAGVNHDTATDGGFGGGIYSFIDQVDATGGSISHDTVAGTNGSGGGIVLVGGAQVGLHGVTMTGDTTAGAAALGAGGGAIYDYVDEYGSLLTVDAHTMITGADNSAVYVYGFYGGASVDVADSTISGNSDTSLNGSDKSSDSDLSGCGGAICADNAQSGFFTVDLTGDAISGNSSTGVFAAGGVVVDAGEEGGAALHLDGDTFQGNVGHGSGSSGAVQLTTYHDSTVSLEATGSTFTQNSAPDAGLGGALDAYNYDDQYSPLAVSLTGDHFTDNSVGSAATDEEGEGGAVFIYSYVALDDHGSTFSANRALGTDASGGAVSDESLQSSRFSGTVFSGNLAPGTGSVGGAYYTDNAAGDVYTGVTMSANSAEYGGAVYAGSDASEQRFTDSTISGNTARGAGSGDPGYGAGIYADGAVLAATNSTISGNTAQSGGSTPGEGGGVFETGRIDIVYSTITANTAAQGGGIYEDGFGGSLLGSIVARNSAGNCHVADTETVLTSLGGNVLGSASCVDGVQSSDKVTTAPGLKPLAANGGPTETVALKAASPAIDRAGYDCPATDQRGQVRSASACDAGAYQLAAGSISTLTPASGHGGRSVTIRGTGFTFARSVYFAAKTAKFLVVRNTRIVAVVPKGHAPGKVVVKVLTPDGLRKVGHFTYTS